MFKVTAEPTFTHDVTAQVPVDGGFEPQTFKARFLVLPTNEIEKFNLVTEDGMFDFLKRIVRSVDDLIDHAGAAVPYSDAVRDQLLRLPYVRTALAQTYIAAVGKAKTGN